MIRKYLQTILTHPFIYKFIKSAITNTYKYTHTHTNIFSFPTTRAHAHILNTYLRSTQTVEGMSSVEEEGFQCRSAVPTEGPVECWMSACEAEMHSSLQVRTVL